MKAPDSTAPKPAPLARRIETVLRYGADPDCEPVSPRRALVFACQLVIEESILRPTRKEVAA